MTAEHDSLEAVLQKQSAGGYTLLQFTYTLDVYTCRRMQVTECGSE